uniref:Uncharacterized protein n=1 Tax=Alexandrium catenella TaxID=2925 RepID=A0A7S1MSC7_ALECA
MSDSVAALTTDEDLMGDLDSVSDPQAFIEAFTHRLGNLTIVPHARVASRLSLHGTAGSNASMDSRRNLVLDIPGDHQDADDGRSASTGSFRETVSKVMRILQKYSVPLVTGVVIAMIWGNVDITSFDHFTEDAMVKGASVLGHPLSLKFLVNDIFMCFFFGLAVKEVTEAILPGGSLSPLKRAINPLMATVGGIVGPAVAYIFLVLILWVSGTFEGKMCASTAASAGHRRLAVAAAAGLTGGEQPCTLGTLINGWGVPTATDISLAWMFALLIFGSGHPSINFLLLLAIVDDAIGMGIIAICYPDPDHPVEPVWLLLVLAALVVSYILRRLHVPFWQAYILLAGPCAWFGLLKAHVHPALALVFVVPLMPASHAIAAEPGVRDLGVCDLSSRSPREQAEDVASQFDVSEEQWRSSAATAAEILSRYHAEEAPLHVFEHTMKLPVDIGMFFFGLCNAGVKLDAVGGITASVVFALIVGKTLGIALFGLLAVCMGFGLPHGLTVVDLFAMSAIGGVGLTVALFVANEAFVDPGLQGQAKFGAVLSVLAAAVGWAIKVVPSKLWPSEPSGEDVKGAEMVDIIPCSEFNNAGPDFIEDCLVDDILHVIWLQRRYAMRGANWSVRSVTKAPTVVKAGSGGLGSAVLPAKQGMGMLTPTWGPNIRARTPVGLQSTEAKGL